MYELNWNLELYLPVHGKSISRTLYCKCNYFSQLITFMFCLPGCPINVNNSECKNPYSSFLGCMKQFSIDGKPIDLISVQQNSMGHFSDLQIDLCGIIDR